MKLRDQEAPPSDTGVGDVLPENVVSISPEALEESLFSLPPVKKIQRSVPDNLREFPKATDLKAPRESKGRKNDAPAGARPDHVSQVDEVPQTPRAPLINRVQALINKVEEKLINGDAKPTVADWIRLTEIERELTIESGPRQIRVTWVTPSESDVKKIFGPRKRGPEGGQDAA